MATTRWKFAEAKTKFSVFGYVRRIQKDFKHYIIPLAIKCYCLSYYLTNDYFTEHGQHIKLDKFGQIAEGKTEEHIENTIFGNETIDSNEYSYKWKLKVSQNDPDCPGFWIGLSDYKNPRFPAVIKWGNHSFGRPSIDKPNLNANCWRECNGKYYFMTNMTTAQTKEMDIISWGKECIIDMSLEYIAQKMVCVECEDADCCCNRSTGWYCLKFYVDGQFFHECEIGTHIPRKLNLTVIIAQKGQTIEILKFDKNLIWP